MADVKLLKVGVTGDLTQMGSGDSLAVANGGTGATAPSAARANLNTLLGDVPVAQAAHGFVVGNLIYASTTTDTWAKAKSDGVTTAANAIVTAVTDSGNFTYRAVGQLVLTTGQWDAVTGQSGGLTAGNYYWLSSTTAGNLALTGVGVNTQSIGKATNPTTLEIKIEQIVTSSVLSSYLAVTTTYQALTSDSVILCDASGGAFTVTLSNVTVSSGKTYIIKKTDSSSNAVTIDGFSTDVIDGALTMTISTQWVSISVFCNGSAWYVV